MSAGRENRRTSSALHALTFGSLFSGCGLADVGLLLAGGTPVFGVEIEDATADFRDAFHLIRERLDAS